LLKEASFCLDEDETKDISFVQFLSKKSEVFNDQGSIGFGITPKSKENIDSLSDANARN
jgi:hypothetical protein